LSGDASSRVSAGGRAKHSYFFSLADWWSIGFLWGLARQMGVNLTGRDPEPYIEAIVAKWR